jgi:hypothetical protein
MYETTACQITVTPAKAGVQSNCPSVAAPGCPLAGMTNRVEFTQAES